MSHLKYAAAMALSGLIALGVGLMFNSVTAGLAEGWAKPSAHALSATPTEPASPSRPIRVTVVFAGEK